MNETELLRILGGLIGCMTGGFGLMLRAVLKRAERSDSIIENHLHENTIAQAQVASAVNRVADVLGNCEDAQVARRERQQQGRMAPIPQIVPKMTGD